MYIRTREWLGEAISTNRTTKSADARLFNFDKASAKLKDFHAPEIDRMANTIAASWSTGQPIFTVYVKGHTSSEGPPQYNIGLGNGRALAVRKALQKALERKQKNLSYKVLILAQSKGAIEPLTTEFSEVGRSQNRRVEVFLSTKQLAPIRPKPQSKATITEQERRETECGKWHSSCHLYLDNWLDYKKQKCTNKKCLEQAYKVYVEQKELCDLNWRQCMKKGEVVTMPPPVDPGFTGLSEEDISDSLVRTKAPDFRFRCKDRDGNKVLVALSKPPGPVLLNFWETWCEHCVEELPDLERIHRDFRMKGLFVVGVSEAEDYQEMMRIRRQKGVTFCQVHDKGGSMTRAFNLKNGDGWPRTFLIDKQGFIQAVLKNRKSYDQFREALRKVLPTKRERVIGRAARD